MSKHGIYIVSFHKGALIIRKIGAFNQKVLSVLDEDIPLGTPIYIGTVNVEHIKNRHPYEYDKYFKDIEYIIDKPDYVGKNPKDNSIIFVKEYKVNEEFIRVGVKVSSHGQYFARTLHLLSNCNACRYIEKGNLKKLDIPHE